MRDQRGLESFADMMMRLFPDEGHGKHVPGGNFVRDITIQVTEDCNLRCTYCYQHNKTPLSMSWETGKKFIDLLLASDERMAGYLRSRECPGACINFIGGEPLLEIDLIDRLTDYTIEQMIRLNHPWLHRVVFGICTNGMLYFDERVQDYIRRNRNHLSMTVTIDGNKRIHDTCRLDIGGHGTYDRAFAAAEHYENNYRSGKNRRGLGTKITISPDNLEHIGEAIIEFIGNGRKDINANCVYEEGWTKEHGTELYWQLKRVADHLIDNGLSEEVFLSILDQKCGDPYDGEQTWCGGNGLMLAVDPRGDLYPCLRYLPNSVGTKVPAFKLGDVDHGMLYDAEQMERFWCLQCITRSSQCEKTEHCKDCLIGTGCGDCAAYSYEVYGEVGRRTTFICDMHKARVLAHLYYWNRLYVEQGKRRPLRVNIPRDWALEIIPEPEFNMICDLARKAEEQGGG